MSFENILKILAKSSKYIANINRLLRNIKSNIFTNFIQMDSRNIIVTINSITIQSDLNMIKKYIKNIDSIQSETIIFPQLPQSKLYLKILGIPYIDKITNTPIYSGTMESIIKSTHIFNDICLASKPCIIKVFLKSDVVIVQIDIWDIQSKANTKTLINRLFNIRKHFATI